MPPDLHALRAHPTYHHLDEGTGMNLAVDILATTPEVVTVAVAAPIIAGLVQIIKGAANLPARWAPVVSIGLGLLGSLVFGVIEGGLLSGIVAGMMASGLYSNIAEPVEFVQDRRHQVDLDDRLRR